MSKSFPVICVLALLPLVLLVLLLPREASAAAVTKVVQTKTGDRFIVSCDIGPITADYAAETSSGVPSSDPYVVSRGGSGGLIRLMNQGGKQTQQYTLPHGDIRAIVRVKFDATALDRGDLVFVPQHLVFVHTTTADSGIFTTSDVYELPYGKSGGAGGKLLQGNDDLQLLLNIGLSSYRPADNTCVP
jgi:hypothetical protein